MCYLKLFPIFQPLWDGVLQLYADMLKFHMRKTTTWVSDQV